ncbi:hypothetical protein GGU11DRAFT_462853 [Lentinula aff. detonsa]|nr:hypothetical protein GGU11DRAFT_462853 [Lentinula aff. detonsa]
MQLRPGVMSHIAHLHACLQSCFCLPLVVRYRNAHTNFLLSNISQGAQRPLSPQAISPELGYPTSAERSQQYLPFVELTRPVFPRVTFQSLTPLLWLPVLAPFCNSQRNGTRQRSKNSTF